MRGMQRAWRGQIYFRSRKINLSPLAPLALAALRAAWRALRRLSGDDAYERYLAHHRHVHAECPPLDRDAFWRAETERRWGRGVQRCC